jgi:hypothetical protein
VLSARGGELERELPFGIVRQLLEVPLVSAGDDERRELLAGAAALAKPVLSGEGAAAEFAALHGLYWLTATSLPGGAGFDRAFVRLNVDQVAADIEDVVRQP